MIPIKLMLVCGVYCLILQVWVCAKSQLELKSKAKSQKSNQPIKIKNDVIFTYRQINPSHKFASLLLANISNTLTSLPPFSVNQFLLSSLLRSSNTLLVKHGWKGKQL